MEEENNSTKLKLAIENVFSASKQVTNKIQNLHESSEKLKNLSKKLET